MSYTIIKDGEILRVVNCRAERIADHLLAGESYLEGAFPKSLFSLGKDGAAVQLKAAPRAASGAESGATVDGPNARQLVRALVRDLDAAGVDLPSVRRMLRRG